MTRMSKQGKRRALSHRKTKGPSAKTGPKANNLEKGYKPHPNAAQNIGGVFIAKIK